MADLKAMAGDYGCAEFSCGHSIGVEEVPSAASMMAALREGSAARRDAAREALFAAIDAAEADRALGAAIRRILAQTAHLEIEELTSGWEARHALGADWDRLPTLDAAVQALAERLGAQEKRDD